jgi:hypothetical protein
MRRTNDDRQSRIARCASVIAQIRLSREPEDVSRSDAELIEGMADRLTADPDQHRLIACALALRFDVGREIEPVCELLEDLGISDVDPQNLMAARQRLRSVLLICALSTACMCRVSTQTTGKPASASAL